MNTPTQPNTRTCAPKWYDVPDEKWFDWRWQLAHRLNSAEELGEIIRLTDSERSAGAHGQEGYSGSILRPTLPA